MANEPLQLNLGSLRSAMSLTLHTHHASRIWHGRAPTEGRAGIIGLNGFISAMNNKMKRGALCRCIIRAGIRKVSAGTAMAHRGRSHRRHRLAGMEGIVVSGSLQGRRGRACPGDLMRAVPATCQLRARGRCTNPTPLAIRLARSSTRSGSGSEKAHTPTPSRS